MRTDASGEHRHVEVALRQGRVRFAGIDLLVAPGALVPRSETELLARTAIDMLAPMAGGRPAVIDMCCGTGNLACAIAHHVGAARVWASDLTEPCVVLARRNVLQLALDERVEVLRGDLFQSLEGLGLENAVDMVVCNPPYISEKRLGEDKASLLALEPEEAFAAGAYGLAVHQRVIRDALAYLRPGGALLVEIGAGQQRQVEMLFARSKDYDGVRAVNDASGEPRVMLGRRRIG